MKQLYRYTFHDKNTGRNWTIHAPEGETPDPHAHIGSLGKYTLVKTEQDEFLHLPLAWHIAGHLDKLTGDKWEPEPEGYERPDHTFYVIREKDGLKIWIAPPDWRGNKARQKFRYSRPRSKEGVVCIHGHDSDPSITVAADKSPEAMAKDITRRLLPDADALHTIVLEKIAALDASLNAQAAAVSRLAAVAGVPVQGNQALFRLGNYRHTVRVNQSGTVEIDARGLTAEQAERLIALLK